MLGMCGSNMMIHRRNSNYMYWKTEKQDFVYDWLRTDKGLLQSTVLLKHDIHITEMKKLTF